MQIMKKNSNSKLLQFFILTFLFSWILWLPGILITYNLINTSPEIIIINNILQWIAGTGPSIVALYMIIKYEGKTGIKNIFNRVLKFKLGYWYIPLFLLLPILSAKLERKT